MRTVWFAILLIATVSTSLAEERWMPMRSVEIATHLEMLGADARDVAELRDLTPLPATWSAGSTVPKAYTDAYELVLDRLFSSGDTRPALQTWTSGSTGFAVSAGDGDYWRPLTNSSSLTLKISADGWYRLRLRIIAADAGSSIALSVGPRTRVHAVSQTGGPIAGSYWCRAGSTLSIGLKGNGIRIAEPIIEGPDFNFALWPSPLHRRWSTKKGVHDANLTRDVHRLLGRPDPDLVAAMKAAHRAGGCKAMLRTVLTHPRFLYRLGKRKPDGMDVRALFNLTALGAPVPERELKPDTKVPHAPNMFRFFDKQKANSHAARTLGPAVDDWLELDKARPALAAAGADEALIESAIAETRAFFIYHLVHNQPCPRLLTASLVIADRRLAAHYHLMPVAAGIARPIQVHGKHPRGGLLSQAALLAIGAAEGEGDIALGRGRYLWRVLFHNDPAVIADLPGASDDDKLRALGSGLDGFDATGAWRGAAKDAHFDAAGLRAHCAKHWISFHKIMQWRMGCFLARREIPYVDPEPTDQKQREKWRKRLKERPPTVRNTLGGGSLMWTRSEK